MKIAIDCRFIFPEISGIGKYTETLIFGLTRIKNEHDYILLFNNEEVLKRTVNKFNLHKLPAFESVLLNYSPFSIKNQFLLPRLLKKKKIELLHVPEFMLPLFTRTKIITTIHDIILVAHPEFSKKALKSRFNLLYKNVVRLMAKKATRIITVSDYSKEDMYKHLKIPKEKITPVYNGIDKNFTPLLNEAAKEQLKEKYGYKDTKIIFYAGRQDPYKNVKGAIETFLDFKKKNPEKKVKLLILGKKDKRYQENYPLAENSDFGEDIIFTGYLNDLEFIDYFKMGDVLLFLSRYEGFGLPVVESMACGVAVLCSNLASLPEIAAHPYSLCDPDDIKKTSEKLAKILNNNELYQELTAAGLKKAKEFTAEKMVENILKQYQL